MTAPLGGPRLSSPSVNSNSGTTGSRGRNVAEEYLNPFFSTNPAGTPVKVTPPEPQLFGNFDSYG